MDSPTLPTKTKEHQVRLASLSDAPYIISLTARVQSALTSSGSLQELTFSSLDTIHASIANQEIFLLLDSSNLQAESSPSYESESEARNGSVTISPFSPSLGHGSSEWTIAVATDTNHRTWYLHSLLLEPSLQGQGIGKLFLQEVLRQMRMRHGQGMVVLDCWAGNEKLRSFYEGVGFHLVDIFPEEGYEIAVFEMELGA